MFRFEKPNLSLQAAKPFSTSEFLSSRLFSFSFSLLLSGDLSSSECRISFLAGHENKFLLVSLVQLSVVLLDGEPSVPVRDRLGSTASGTLAGHRPVIEEWCDLENI